MHTKFRLILLHTDERVADFLLLVNLIALGTVLCQYLEGHPTPERENNFAKKREKATPDYIRS